MNRPTALKAALEQRPAETTVKRIWRDIESHRYAQEKPIFRRYGWMAAAIAVSVIAVSVLLHLSYQAPESLMLADGSAMPEKVAGPRANSFKFADGSSIHAHPNTRFDVLINRKNAIEFALRKGAMSIQVTPGGERRWTIHSGEVDVIVVGTAFDVIRTDQYVTVKVHRGKVCVKGTGVPDGIQMLTASSQISVPSATVNTVSKPPLPSKDISSAESHAALQPLDEADSIEVPLKKGVGAYSQPTQPVDPAQMPRYSQKPAVGGLKPVPDEDQKMSADAVAPLAELGASADIPSKIPNGKARQSEETSLPPWKQFAQSGQFDAAYRALPAFTFSNLNATQWSPDDLFLLSDVARITQHPNEAAAALEALIRRYPDNPRAGIAAYTLARVTTESLRQPGKGATCYEQALELGISKALRETALIRLMEHYRHIAPHKARRYENIYIAEYPRGRYLEEINRHSQASKP